MHHDSATQALKDATRMHRATVRWLTWCEWMHATHVAAGMFTREDYNTEPWRQDMIAQERAYMAANKRPSMPSKTHKHRMYGEVYRAAGLADVEVAPGSIRDMAGIAAVLAQVTAALAA
jgi:hypothetical protein